MGINKGRWTRISERQDVAIEAAEGVLNHRLDEELIFDGYPGVFSQVDIVPPRRGTYHA